MSLPAFAPAPLTAEELTAALCQVLAAYTGQRPTDKSVQAAAAGVVAVAAHGWGAVHWEFDNHTLRTVRTEPTFRFLGR
jgi:hypothetical protein